MSIDIGSRARWSSIPSQVYKQLFIIDIWNRLLSVSPLPNDSRHNRIHRFQSFEWNAEKQFSRSIYCSIFLCSHFIGEFAQDFIWKAFGSQVQNCTCFSLKHCFSFALIVKARVGIVIAETRLRTPITLSLCLLGFFESVCECTRSSMCCVGITFW